MVAGCNSTETSSAGSSTAQTQDANAAQDFRKQDLKALFPEVGDIYKTEYFALGIPKGWTVVSFSNEKYDSAISVEKNDHSTLVTVRVNSAIMPTIKETCEHAYQGYLANGAESVQGPAINYGTCIIEAKDSANKDLALWLRQYDDDQSVYSINYSGSLETVGELLSYLVGNEKLMQLMVRPL